MLLRGHSRRPLALRRRSSAVVREVSSGLKRHERLCQRCKGYKKTAGSKATPTTFICADCVVEQLAATRYLTRTFWSPCKRYLVTVHVVGGNIETVQDDSGREWKPASPQQEFIEATPGETAIT